MAYPKPTVDPPSKAEILADLEAAVMDSRTGFETTDGCEVEADGTCQHSHPTWLVRLGLM